MGWSASEIRCKKHPKHKQSSGVCSICLRERLSKLSSKNNKISSSYSSYSSSPSTSYSSASASSSSSTPPEVALGVNDRISFVLRGNFEPTKGHFGRSQSVAVAMVKGADLSGEQAVNRKKKSGFWSRLLRPAGSKRSKELLHSNTVREVPSNWVYSSK